MAFVSAFNLKSTNLFPTICTVFQSFQEANGTKKVFGKHALTKSQRQPPNFKNLLIKAKYSNQNKLCTKSCNRSHFGCCQYTKEGNFHKFNTGDFFSSKHFFSILCPKLLLLYMNNLPDDVICNITIYTDLYYYLYSLL